MKTALVIQPAPFEDAGYFAPLLQALGYRLQIIEAPLADFSSVDPLAADVWLVLGAPIGVYDHADYPFLNGVIQLLKQRLAADLPTLGICLGCQLIAAALGAEVYPSGHQEIGWKIIQLTKQGQESCLQALSTQAVLHWHGDTFDLPQGATHLAASDRCHNQAFALGRTLALQFHPEVTAQGLERWLVGHSHQLQSLSLSVTGLRADNQRYAPRLQPHGSLMLERWLHSVEN